MQIEIKIIESQIRIEIETIEEYFKLIEDSISSVYKSHSQSLNKKLEILEEEDAQRYYETHIDEVFKLREIMPSYHRYSIFLLIYNFFEHNLNMLCVICEKQIKNDISLKDLSGKGIHKSKLYLTKIMKYTEAFRDIKWNTFLFYNELRNIIVHNGSFVSEQNKELPKKIAIHSGVTISSYRTILFKREFIENYLLDIKEFFDLLFT
ncbi:MAG: hypothetical protein COZ80_07055, partial [Ignavibacteria bacterium CG_4_8_14_3_um_filter_37_9]